ncbi:bifunctional adenosylcobinamide kinase/adenosylcobinamide-phosphate guanylyltransferase [Rhodococcus sp. BP-241]|nr:bifunctional adenosylcobinamide kinase/adenosylcobinamide-phosphate guanylyltransferase [Rhodococcus sp. BP-241]
MSAPAVTRTLVLGGARSGKSGHAESLLAGHAEVRYVATGRRNSADADWDARIDTHRRTRPEHWSTVEITSYAALSEALRDDVPTLVDDLGTWLTGALDDLRAWDSPRGTVVGAVDDLVTAVDRFEGPLVLVSPEVGLGVIPESRAGRLFRDEIGAANARLAQVCDAVTLVVAGLFVPLSRPSDRPTDRSRGTW